MTITWFTENYPPSKGGMSRSCDRIIANLRLYHTVNIFHFTNKQKAFSTEGEINGTYTAVPVYEDASHTLNVLWAYIEARSNAIKSDIFVGFGSHLCLNGITLMAKWLNKPVLICIRGNDFDNGIFSRKKQDLLYTLQNASAIACVTKEKLKRINHLALKTACYYTPNAISFKDWTILKADLLLAQSYKEQLQLNKNTKIIGLIGFLKQKKGIGFFIDTLKKSALKGHCHLRIVGELEDDLEQLLIANEIAYSLAVSESQTTLMANYIMCDAIAIPSIYDGMPNVIFEAAALDVPIIASKAGGIPDVLDHENAFLFDVLSEKSLLQALSDFDFSTKKELELKSYLLKCKLKKEFTVAQETQNYLDLFKSMIANHKINYNEN